MKIIPLRQLLREPTKVKRWTRAGQVVQVTENGKPLWEIHPATAEEDDEKRARAIDEILDEVLREPRSTLSVSEILLESRR